MAGTKEEIPLLKWLKKGMRGFGALYLLLLNTKALFLVALEDVWSKNTATKPFPTVSCETVTIPIKTNEPL